MNFDNQETFYQVPGDTSRNRVGNQYCKICEVLSKPIQRKKASKGSRHKALI